MTNLRGESDAQRSELLVSEAAVGSRIAIVGMAGRFPGAGTLDEFWSNLRTGTESIRFFSRDELVAGNVDPALVDDPTYVPAQGVLEGVDRFDAGFFDTTPRDAALLDPQQRLLLECAWEALESSGHVAVSSSPVGVFAGVGFPQYLITNLLRSEDLATDDDRYVAISNDKDYVSSRIAHKLGLTGPSVTVQTACSTSLVAVHLACQALLAGECDLALAGGLTVRLPQVSGYRYVEGGVDSPDGHCRAFDALAGGMVRGCGGGMVALRRLEDARAADDLILAVIRSTAVNNDGSDKLGYTAPSVNGQARVIQVAHQVAGISPDDISYVEAHGTGTRLGDPVEIAALTKAFRARTRRTGYCAIGSLKTNIGHLDAGAGVAGLIKTVLALRNEEIPPSLHYQRQNPEIDFDSTPFEVATELRPWRRSSRPRRAGVSAFGIGGTNAHVVLEEAPRRPSVPPGVGPHLLTLSARSESALEAASRELADHLTTHSELDLADVAYTLQTGRREFEYRKAVTANNAAEAVAALRDAGSAHVDKASGASHVMAFLFPGQGMSLARAGAGLYRHEPIFRQYVDECAGILNPMLGDDVRGLLFPEASDAEEVFRELQSTAFAQPALFTLEYSLAQLWRSWGVQPDVVLGHSLGEYVAACVSGVFSLEDALDLLAARNALVHRVPVGVMLAVAMADNDLRLILPPEVSLAAVNSATRCVVAGPPDSVGDFERILSARGVRSARLTTSHALHSAMLEPVLADFRRKVETVELQAPQHRYLSSLTGDWATATDLTDPEYWVRHLRETVRFGDAVETLASVGPVVSLEMGVGDKLSRLIAQRVPDTIQVGSLAAVPEQEPTHIREAAGRVWQAGFAMDWAALNPGGPRRRIPLPTYPFQRQRHWIEPGTATRKANRTRKADVGDWCYQPFWRPAGPALPPSARESWLVVAGHQVLAESVIDALRPFASSVAVVRPGANVALELERMRAAGRKPRRVAYIPEEQPRTHVGEAAEESLWTLMRLAQALAADPEPVHLNLVTTRAQPVLHREPINLGHSTLLGVATVLPQEASHVVCRSIDVGAGAERSGDAGRIAAELVSASEEPAVALRDDRRWLPDVSPIALTEPGEESGLREGGTYLLTGGLGAVGLEIAEFLAKTCRARLILTGRRAFPDPEQWPQILQAAAEKEHGETGSAGVTGRLAELDQGPPDRPRARRAAEVCARLCAWYVYDYLAKAGVNTTAGRSYSAEELTKQLGVTVAYQRFLHSLLKMPAEDGLVTWDGQTLTFVCPPDEVIAPHSMDMRIRQEYPEFTPILRLLKNCVEAYPEVLTGCMDPLEVLFPHGQASDLDTVTRLMGEHSDQGHYLGVLRDFIRDLPKPDGGRPLRVLEVGAGKGRLTDLLVDILGHSDVEYHITDVSAAFVNGLRNRHGGADGVRFGVLDVTESPSEQGYPPEGFDVLVGFNVVHATPQVGTSLDNLRGLLAPGGLLCLVETVTDERWAQLIWGLTKEWWSYSDIGLRPSSPLLPATSWVESLERAGFADTVAWPAAGENQDQGDCAIVIGSRPGRPGPAVADIVRRLQAITRLGTEVLVRSVDVSDPSAVRGLVEEAETRFGDVNGVFHLAVDSGGGLIELRDRAQVRAELAPKVSGTLALDEVFRNRRLDFMILFSSLNALIGGHGAAAYAGASAFVDRFAHAVSGQRGYPVIAVNWTLWNGLGTAISAQARRRWFARDRDEIGMRPADGLAVLRRILAARLGPQLAICPVDLSLLLREATADLLPKAAATARTTGAGPARAAANAAPSDAVEQVSKVWYEVLGIDSIDVDADFAELGGDSLIATQIVSRLRDELGLELSLRDFFGAPTIAGNVAAIAGVDAPRPETTVTYQQPDLETALLEIEQMSDEEVRHRLAVEDAEVDSPGSEAPA